MEFLVSRGQDIVHSIWIKLHSVVPETSAPWRSRRVYVPDDHRVVRQEGVGADADNT